MLLQCIGSTSILMSRMQSVKLNYTAWWNSNINTKKLVFGPSLWKKLSGARAVGCEGGRVGDGETTKFGLARTQSQVQGRRVLEMRKLTKLDSEIITGRTKRDALGGTVISCSSERSWIEVVLARVLREQTRWAQELTKEGKDWIEPS